MTHPDALSSSGWVRGAALAVAPLFLLGCHRAPELRTLEVRVPVPVPCPTPPTIEIPDLEIGKINSDSSPDQVAKASIVTIHQLMTTLKQALNALDAYRNQPKETPK